MIEAYFNSITKTTINKMNRAYLFLRIPFLIFILAYLMNKEIAAIVSLIIYAVITELLIRFFKGTERSIVKQLRHNQYEIKEDIVDGYIVTSLDENNDRKSTVCNYVSFCNEKSLYDTDELYNYHKGDKVYLQIVNINNKNYIVNAVTERMIWLCNSTKKR